MSGSSRPQRNRNTSKLEAALAELGDDTQGAPALPATLLGAHAPVDEDEDEDEDDGTSKRRGGNAKSKPKRRRS